MNQLITVKQSHGSGDFNNKSESRSGEEMGHASWKPEIHCQKEVIDREKEDL